MLSRVYDDYDIVIVDKSSLRATPRKTNNKRGESAKKFQSTQKRGKKSEGAAREYTNRIDSLVAYEYLTMEDVAEFLLRAFSEDDIKQAYAWMEQDELIPSESALADEGLMFNDDGDLVSLDSDESYRRARRAHSRIR
jgi:hypothetical protein